MGRRLNLQSIRGPRWKIIFRMFACGIRAADLGREHARNAGIDVAGATAREADARSDIWAMGVTLYEMVSGTRPFHGQNGFESTLAILNRAPRPLPCSVPAELGAVVARCLEKEPGKRYQ